MRKQRRAEKSIQVVIYIIEALFLIGFGGIIGFHDKFNVFLIGISGLIGALSLYLVVTCKALYDTREGN